MRLSILVSIRVLSYMYLNEGYDSCSYMFYNPGCYVP